MSKKTIKIGLIGCGKVAVNRHLPALKHIKEAEVISVSDIDENRLNKAADKFKIKKRFSDYRELLNDPDVEAVGICAPLEFHFEIVKASLEKGKHILLEKPLAMSLDEADLLIDMARNTNLKVMLGLNKRWHRLVRKAREIIKKEILGPISLIRTFSSTAHYNRYMPEWRRHRKMGGGNILENGTHAFDIWHFLIGSKIEEVRAISSSFHKCDDEPAVVLARTSDGILFNSTLSDFLPDRNEIEIFGRDYILRISLHKFDGLELLRLHSHDGDVKNRIKNAIRFIKELPHAVIQARYGGDFRASFRAEWKHFIDCIIQDKPVECTLEDGKRALKIALASLKAASSGEPVKLSDVPHNITVPSGIS